MSDCDNVVSELDLLLRIYCNISTNTLLTPNLWIKESLQFLFKDIQEINQTTKVDMTLKKEIVP